MYGDVFVRHARTRDVGTQHAEKASNAEPAERNGAGRIRYARLAETDREKAGNGANGTDTDKEGAAR